MTYGELTRSETAWNWRAAAQRASFTPAQLVEHLMKSSYKRIAALLLNKFFDHPEVEFAADMWDGPGQTSGWGVRATWTITDLGKTLHPSGIFYHASSEDDAQAVVDAIAAIQRSRE